MIVNEEPLWKEHKHKYVGLGLYDYGPIKYLDGNRTGICGEVKTVCYLLFKTKGENVRIARARNVNYNIDSEYIGDLHAWVEIEIDDRWYAIDFDDVIPLEK